MNDIIIAVITGIISLFAGGGGVFAYLNSKEKTKQNQHDSAIAEWKDLYDEMKKRLDAQEDENKKLSSEIFELKQTVNNLTIELQNYKKYDTYIIELEKYVDHLLHTSKTLVSEEAYRNMCAKRPKRNIYEKHNLGR